MKRTKDSWKIWDSIFFSGILSLMKDSKDAENDEKKFKQLLYQLLFGIVLTVILFALGFWIIGD
jgi:hypothetical protein